MLPALIDAVVVMGAIPGAVTTNTTEARFGGRPFTPMETFAFPLPEPGMR